MASKSDIAVSENEKAFVFSSLAHGLRLDGRGLLDVRKTKFAFTRSANRSTAEVQLGRTRVFAVTTATVVPPFPDRPNEGFLQVSVDFSPAANPSFEAGRPSDAAAEVTRVLEKILKDARAIDTEALCIMSGSKAWSVRLDVHVLDDAGNLLDAASMASMASLLHFRKSDISITGTDVIVHDYDEKPPVPLSVHHTPLCLTFGVFSVPDAGSDDEDSGAQQPAASSASALHHDGRTREVLVLDPASAEEHVMVDRITFAINAHGELCLLHKLGGAPLATDDVLRYGRLASKRGVTLVAHMQSVLKRADDLEAERAMQAHAAAAGYDDSGRLVSASAGESKPQAVHALLPDITVEGGMRLGNSSGLASASGDAKVLRLHGAQGDLSIAASSSSKASS